MALTITPRGLGQVISPTSRTSPRLFQRRLNYGGKPTRAPTTAHLECERKFNITPFLRTRLESKQPINNLIFTKSPTKIFQDKYYDVGTRLLDRGIWLRSRTQTPNIPHSGVWEAKLKLGQNGDYINSKFEEVSGEREVYLAIKKRFPIFSLSVLKLMGFSEITAAISTEREVWKGSTDATDLEIVIDKVSSVPLTKVEEEMPFEHVVGEVEATKALLLEEDVEENQKVKLEELARMDELIKDCMVDKEIFPTDPAPVGKLTKYAEWKEVIKKEEWRQKMEELRRKGYLYEK